MYLGNPAAVSSTQQKKQAITVFLEYSTFGLDGKHMGWFVRWKLVNQHIHRALRTCSLSSLNNSVKLTMCVENNQSDQIEGAAARRVMRGLRH